MDCHNYCFLQPRYLIYTVTKKIWWLWLYDRCHDVFKNLNEYFIRLYYHAKVQSFCWKGKRVWVGVFTGKRVPQISFCDVICGSEEGGNPRTPWASAMQIQFSHICSKRASTIQHSFLKILIILCNKKI